MMNCDNCGKEFFQKIYSWKGYMADYCCVRCAVESCPSAILEVKEVKGR